ncbi:uncharacterized protein PFB0765w-like [Xenia sp. Carnegie-2017]|uniref:uncharacterized protein PFB0765w-like n=1 Tax=Xenia sp. Carnegie-2017 TaxID=2897299 RepID=UPI001F040DB1|nr:uncharacterized protein PFB0765w-like [Xenia sp. Carnegie-2017]XP_046843482.1 uncharacterized protein PFB0765w-like [Xenia sp. Carnegie-2017]
MATAKDKDEQKEIENLHIRLLNHLKNIPKVENFAECLHSIYYMELASSVKDKYVDDFKEIQKQVRNDAFIFLKVLLPLTEKMLTYIENFFEEYDDTYEEWKKEIEGILNDVEENAKNARLVGLLAEKLTSVAKDNKVRIENLLKIMKSEHKFQKSIEDLEKKAQLCEQKATDSSNPFTKMYNRYMERKWLNEAALLKDEREKWLQEHFSTEMNDMLNALSNFITSINGIATFFSNIHKDIENCWKASKVSNVSENSIVSVESKVNVPDPENTNERKKKKHFEATKKISKDIKYQIQVCFTSMPNIRSSLDAIPKTDIDENCVQDWVKKYLEKIYAKFFSKFLSNAIPSIEWTQVLAIKDE